MKTKSMRTLAIMVTLTTQALDLFMLTFGSNGQPMPPKTRLAKRSSR